MRDCVTVNALRYTRTPNAIIYAFRFSEIVKSCHMFEDPTKIIPSRITSLDFHSSEKNLLLLCGDKNGHLCKFYVFNSALDEFVSRTNF